MSIAEIQTADRPAEAQITDEAVAEARKIIGQQLRPEGPFLQDATADTLRNWCNGIGDTNPLYREMEHGRLSRHGSQVLHPMFPIAYGWIGRTRWGLPGVHGFYAGNDWELFRHIRPGDRVNGCVRRLACLFALPRRPLPASAAALRSSARTRTGSSANCSASTAHRVRRSRLKAPSVEA
jgi:hypothetical protein